MSLLFSTSSPSKLIVFDLDGTLVDSVPSLAMALNQTLQALDLPQVSLTQARHWVGNGIEVLVARGISQSVDICPDLNQTQHQQGVSLFKQFYGASDHSADTLYPNVKTTLIELVGQGHTLAVLTNKAEVFVRPILQHFDIEQYFSDAIGGDTLAEKKPSPIGLNVLTQKHGYSIADTVMVGDSENDIFAARAAGCCAIGLTYGYNYDRPIADSSPDYVCSDIQALLSLPLASVTENCVNS
ncbi:phosphoglycolate phosphatase [Endozoicomonas sp. G2_1]|uniref:phosphoglycolate phosphatase n=1 Tax=Endozoicomonas sp. G2_1 TaxID=2821091 RepID=UPI001ADCD3C6|nr:phosphoglycolate phosphatase [Endozoicomonas sp. G2_1]MBO9491700.1 phosphoglycolate phosphatase [Endozoicomonas sp. G2_1]